MGLGRRFAAPVITRASVDPYHCYLLRSAKQTVSAMILSKADRAFKTSYWWWYAHTAEGVRAQ